MKEKLKNIFKKIIRSPIIAAALIIFVILVLFLPEIVIIFGATFHAPMLAVIKFLKFLLSLLLEHLL